MREPARRRGFLVRDPLAAAGGEGPLREIKLELWVFAAHPRRLLLCGGVGDVLFSSTPTADDIGRRVLASNYR